MRNPGKASLVCLIAVTSLSCFAPAQAAASDYDLQVALELSTGTPLGQLRAVPVTLAPDKPKAILLIYCSDAEVDPYVEMFFFPKDTLKLKLVSQTGDIIWRKELGPGLVPGIWFCPFYPFDLDGDGADEIWFVNNIDDDHPLSHSGRKLERLDPRTGKTTGRWPWPAPDRNQSPSHTFRNFILGGYVKDEPVLITAHGTYGPMKLQGRNPDLTIRWEYPIPGNAPGAKGSHMCPVVDINHDGVDEFFWGERCIEMDSGKELFCCDRDVYRGHSDVIQPVLDSKTNRWYIHTCRESTSASPRVCFFDDTGERIWGHVDQGHMDMGWTARIGPRGGHVAMAIRIGGKSAGPQGFFRKGVEQFTYDAFTGAEHPLDFSVFCTVPVDLNGDGVHELVRGLAEGNADVLDRTGKVLGNFGGSVAMASKFMNLPGEQVLCYYPGGAVRIWADKNAADSPAATRRYRTRFYRANQQLTATGYNIVNLGGI
jgi:hypothetical protein